MTDLTFSGNQATGSGAAIVINTDFGDSGITTYFTLNNSIIVNNGANECFYNGTLIPTGAANIIMHNGSGGQFEPCPGVVITSDPQLQPLQLNPGPGNMPVTPTMAIFPTSPAVGKADAATSLPTDQRGVPRPPSGSDIGAFETSPGSKK